VSDSQRKRHQMRYVNGVPKSVPEGQVLVHNHVTHEPNTPIGLNGFRAWLQPMTDDPPLVQCDCGWGARAGVHYRVDLERANQRHDDA